MCSIRTWGGSRVLDPEKEDNIVKPLLTVFIDALKPESIKYMPFINSLRTKMRIKTELGYSNPSHASMYSGVYPNKHLHWFVWEYSPQTSPFRWIQRLRLDKLPHNIYTKYLCYRISRLSRRRVTSYHGIPFLWYIPIKYWHYFDVTEKKFWSEPGFLGNYPTIFDILENNGIEYQIVGMTKNASDSSKIIEKHRFEEVKPWTYLFIGDIDALSHKYGQDSIEARKRLAEIDQILESKYRFFKTGFEDFSFMLFSDHGHIKVEGRVNLGSFFSSQARQLNDYIHLIDSNYARFWFRNEKERREVSKILSILDDKGFILSPEHLKKYNLDMLDNRYGDLIFYLDAHYIFDRGEVYALGKKRSSSDVSMHGYLPDYPNSDGVFVSNREVTNKAYISLEDITPSILYFFNIQVPDYMDGKVLWR